MRLPQRLAAVLRQIPRGLAVVDVGTGHGLLAAALAEREPAGVIIATEVAKGPWIEAKDVLGAQGPDRVDLRIGWGLEPIAPGEASVLILAGMGGETICAILTAGEDVARSAQRLVLQPQNHAEMVRGWLLSHGFTLVSEDLAVQRGRFHPVCVGVPEAGAGGGTIAPAQGEETPEAVVERFAWSQGVPEVPGALLLEVGPLLVAGRHPALRGLLDRRLAEGRAVLTNLGKAGTPRAGHRARELGAKLEWLERMSAWLSPSAQ